MDINIASATVIAASIGAFFGGGFMIINGWRMRRSEERRQIRELAVRVAIEEWRWQSNATLASTIATRRLATIHPLDLYLIHAMYFVRELDGRLKTECAIRAHIRQANAITKAANQEIAGHDKGDKKEEKQEEKQGTPN